MVAEALRSGDNRMQWRRMQARDKKRWFVQDSAPDTPQLTSSWLREMQAWRKLVLGIANKKEIVSNI